MGGVASDVHLTHEFLISLFLGLFKTHVLDFKKGRQRD